MHALSLRIRKSSDDPDHLFRIICMDPVTGLWNINKLCCRKNFENIRIILLRKVIRSVPLRKITGKPVICAEYPGYFSIPFIMLSRFFRRTGTFSFHSKTFPSVLRRFLRMNPLYFRRQPRFLKFCTRLLHGN